ncbi:IscS subfamily cysteine desulfurase [Spongiibacter taiwanensis]|uniref:IscS subfamily cysteine desulfurase n=1 Tax=Spongiibacter taiwanensis TaxID=1748242 RepID=UPI0020353207|nr:IscS subfamily cysteine desulfurase [Spongiibacter taiwanensis]USA43003.1 IscS subfamily cysteine desulfurase [Spongiibacter taiwanensis]
MSLPIYLDYAATTPVDPKVAEKMAACLTLEGNFANPASRSHLLGWQAEAAVENSRRQVAQLIGADVREIVWTSGATEADNLAIKGVAEAYADRGRHIITSTIEHKAVLDTCAYLESRGFDVTYLKPNAEGVISAAEVKAALRDDTILVSLMHVNNELGSINDIAAIADRLRDHQAFFHVDAAQSLGKLSLNLADIAVDLMSLSAHKCYGPKGIGALFVRRRSRCEIAPQIHGGGHERGMRSGTLATHQIVGFGEACALAMDHLVEEQARLQSLKQGFLDAVLPLTGVQLNGQADGWPGIVNLSFADVDGELLLMALKDLAVSTGSACASASLEPSYVLRGIGCSEALALSSVRFSFGRYTSAEELARAATMVADALARLRGGAQQAV